MGQTTIDMIQQVNSLKQSLKNHTTTQAFKFETPEGTLVKQRFFLVKQRLYQLITEIPKARESALSSDVEKFMSSFQLL